MNLNFIIVFIANFLQGEFMVKKKYLQKKFLFFI